MGQQYLLFCLLLSLPVGTLVGQAETIANYPGLDSILAAEYPATGPGIVVLASRGDEIVFQGSYGLADLATRAELTTDMTFEIGSMTKQFTSAAVLQLVEAGKVKLDDPIQTYVNSFPDKGHPVTIHHLLSQTSGLPEFFDVDEEEFHLLATEHTPEQLVDYYRDLPLDFEPGTRFAYSNANYPLLGMVIERVSGLSLAEYFERFLFTPIGMDQSSLWYTADSPPAPAGYRISAANEMVRSPKIVGSTVYAAGGIVSTLRDLHRWNDELRQPTHLSGRLVKQLTREKKTTDRRPTGYGYGFFVGELLGRRTVHHGGNMYGFTSKALYLPKEDIYVCVLENRAFGNADNVARFIAARLLGESLPYYRQLPPDVLQDYVGHYAATGPTEKRIELKLNEGVLVVHFPDDPDTDVAIYSQGMDTFSSPQVGLKIAFTRDDSGGVSSFTAYQGGEFVFRRVE